MNNLIIQTQQTMSSLEIAELTSTSHKHVLDKIRTTFEEVGIRQADFSASYKAGNGQMQPCFNLPRRECDLIIAGYSAKYRLAIIDRWQELEQLNKPKELTILDYAKALIESDARLQEETRLRLEEKENNQALAQLMNLSNKEEDREDNHWAAVRILKLINK